jgi:hypothetical protein
VAAHHNLQPGGNPVLLPLWLAEAGPCRLSIPFPVRASSQWNVGLGLTSPIANTALPDRGAQRAVEHGAVAQVLLLG